MSIEARSASLGAPISTADSTGAKGVHRIAVSTTAGSSAVPAGMVGQFVRIQSATANTQIAFTQGAAQTLVINQAAALGTGHAAAGWTVFASSSQSFYVPAKTTHINYVADAAGFIEIFRDECSAP
jgi:hypothetical protein